MSGQGKPPPYGSQEMQILENGDVVIHSTQETVKAQPGEDLADFLERLRTEHGVGPDDRVIVRYSAGTPAYACIARAQSTATEGEEERPSMPELG